MATNWRKSLALNHGVTLQKYYKLFIFYTISYFYIQGVVKNISIIGRGIYIQLDGGFFNKGQFFSILEI